MLYTVVDVACFGPLVPVRLDKLRQAWGESVLKVKDGTFCILAGVLLRLTLIRFVEIRDGNEERRRF